MFGLFTSNILGITCISMHPLGHRLYVASSTPSSCRGLRLCGAISPGQIATFAPGGRIKARCKGETGERQPDARMRGYNTGERPGTNVSERTLHRKSAKDTTLWYKTNTYNVNRWCERTGNLANRVFSVKIPHIEKITLNIYIFT